MNFKRLTLGGLATAGALGAGLAVFAYWTARRVEAAAPARGRFLEVDGARIHYLDQGAGPTILMIHGLGGVVDNFTYALTKRLGEGFRVVVMERPGSGYSSRARRAHAGPRGQAQTIAQFIRSLGLQRPLVVGHSLGGAIALAVALDHPDVVGGLALISPLTQPQTEPPPPLRGLAIASPRVRALVAWTVATPMGLLRAASLRTALFGPEPVPTDFGLRGGGDWGLRPASFYAASTDMMAISDDLPELARRYGDLDLPVGILFGACDVIVDPATHGRFTAAVVPGVTYEQIEGGGHMIPLTQPARTAAFILEMARRVAASPTRSPA